VPLPLYSGQESYELVFEHIVQPVAEEFKPQIIIRNGGSDPYVGDGLTNLGLQMKGFTMIGEKVREIAQICDDSVIDLILSGYNKEALPHAWLAQICGLAGIDIALEELHPIPTYLGVDRFLVNIQAVIQDVKNHHKDYWRCLR
jgi:acetoin utilization protein AcuC